MIFDTEEQEILKAYAAKKLKKLRLTKKKRGQLKQIARNTITKDKRINIRISSQDLEELQLRAVQDGIPYQTLMSSILHKFLNGRLIESPINIRPKTRRRA
jgi:predicted DNA binding CopG/RHH family protein